MENHIISLEIKNFKELYTDLGYLCGAFHKIMEKSTSTIYAAKIIGLQFGITGFREIDILCQIHHPAIVKTLGYSFDDFEGNNCISIVMKYFKGGSLS